MLGLSRHQLFINFAIWSVISLFTATQLYLRSLNAGGEDSWIETFSLQLFVWWIWGVITPLVYWLGVKFRIDKGQLWLNAFIHVVSGAVLVVVFLGCYAAVWNLYNHGTITASGFQTIFVILFLNLFHWHFFIYMAIIGIVHARSYFLESQQRAVEHIRLEKELLSSQLNFLKMQLRPHFLFNTLNSIVSSIEQSKKETAVNMTTELSDLLRMSLQRSDRQMISLKEELDHLKSYLKIEKYRFKDLEVRYDIDDGLEDIEVPNFLLQPLVENAVKHGISKKASAKAITITCTSKGDQTSLAVYNEGPELSIGNEGVGLSNIRKRLEAIYRDAASFEIFSLEDGVLAKICIPT
ncbi:MAG: histidine kinase [Bacteroidota bacterium]